MKIWSNLVGGAGNVNISNKTSFRWHIVSPQVFLP